ncbi:MAG TPA: TonB-dependent receptor [Blastocatellia bacterium]|nr:TonB-dependent receptor [Blastocatellia bacterium]
MSNVLDASPFQSPTQVNKNSMRYVEIAGLKAYEHFPQAFSRILAGILLTCMLWAGSTAAGVRGQGKIDGSVTDPAGAKVAGARVVLRNATGSAAYETTSDRDGHFSFDGVAKGRYRVSAVAPALTQTEDYSVTVEEGSTTTVEVRLNVAALTDQMAVTATRTETPIEQLGGSVSIINSADLIRANQTTVVDALRLVPGLAVVRTGGRGGITSIFAEGGDSDYSKVLVDGVPVNAAGGSFDFSALSPENLDRIEVVRGPSSALFGSDAMTSVVQLFTRRGATRTPELELTGEGGSFDFHRETALLSGAYRFFDYTASFGFQTTAGRFQNSDFTGRSASTNLGFRLGSNSDLRITSRWNNDSVGVPGPTAVFFSDPDEREKHHDLALAATLSIKDNSRWNQSARFVYSEFDTNSFDPVAQDLTQPGTPALPPGGFGFDSAFAFIDHEKRSGIHYQTIASLTSSNLFTAGADFEHESAVFTSFDPFSGGSRVTPDRNDLGVYLQDQAGWHDSLFLTAGVRIEHNSGRVPADLRSLLASGAVGPSTLPSEVGFGWTAVPKIALSYLARRYRENGVFGSSRLKASFGTGIKEPTLVQAFSPAASFIGNPALNPERATSFAVGAVQEFIGRRASVEVSYYDNRFRDQIIFDETPAFAPIQLPDGRLTNFINANRSSARGVQVIAALAPGAGGSHPVLSRLRLSGSYTFLRSRLDSSPEIVGFPPPSFQGTLIPNPEVGLPLLRRPRNSGTFELSWIDRRFDIVFDGSILGWRRDLDPATFAVFNSSGQPIFNDGYAKVDWSGSYHFNKTLTAFGRIDNLLNQNYQEVLGFPAYKLTFVAGLKLAVGGDK